MDLHQTFCIETSKRWKYVIEICIVNNTKTGAPLMLVINIDPSTLPFRGVSPQTR